MPARRDPLTRILDALGAASDEERRRYLETALTAYGYVLKDKNPSTEPCSLPPSFPDRLTGHREVE